MIPEGSLSPGSAPPLIALQVSTININNSTVSTQREMNRIRQHIEAHLVQVPKTQYELRPRRMEHCK